MCGKDCQYFGFVGQGREIREMMATWSQMASRAVIRWTFHVSCSISANVFHTELQMKKSRMVVDDDRMFQ